MSRIGMLAAVAVVVGAHAAGAQEEARIEPRSDVPGLTLSPLADLPKPPAGAGPSDLCLRYVATPASEAGKAVRARGWTVTGEARVGELTAVSFAARFEPATSGTCVVRDGNVGLFDGTQLRVVAYAQRGSDRTIGRVEPLEGGGARIWDGDPPGQPVADLTMVDGRARLGTLAPSETLCGGRARVPNIYGMPIDKARRALSEAGWRPVPGDPKAGDERFGREPELRRRGIVEVDGCSGTGFGFCLFVYRGASGRLSVTTMGEEDLPVVSGYGASCS